MSKYAGKYSEKVRLAARITQIMFWQMHNRLELTDVEIRQAADAVFGKDSDVGDMCDIDSALSKAKVAGVKTNPFNRCVFDIEQICDDYLEALAVPNALAE